MIMGYGWQDFRTCSKPEKLLVYDEILNTETLAN